MTTIINQTLLDQYRVDDFIASGGMGAVYRVWDLKRNVYLAMKILHSELAEDPSIYKRFQREARALKKLAHPNIVPFYGLHKSGGTAFLLEHYIDGPTLKDVLRNLGRQSLSMENVSIILKALTAALGYAHEHDVVHCDVKPGNVMMDWGGTVYLTDFGIARHAESMVTTLGFAGTAAYMAPEQCRAEPVSPATDIYALGVLLFEIMTGQRPFHGDESGTEGTGNTAAERVRHAHLHIPPPDPKEINPNISEDIASVILKALKKEHRGRYGSMQELFQDFCTAAGFDPNEIKNRLKIPKSLFSERGNVGKGSDFVALPEVKPPIAPPPSLPGSQWKVIVGIGVVIIGFILVRVLTSGRTSSVSPSEASATANFLEADHLTQTASAVKEARIATSAVETNVAQVTEEARSTQIAERLSWTSTPTEPPTLTPTPGPMFTDIRFCDRRCDEPGAQTITSAPERVKKIHLSYAYNNMLTGIRYTRIWTMYGVEWVHIDCVWQGPRNGTFYLELYDLDNGIRSGPWVISLNIEGELVAQDTILVEGDYSYWDPAGYISCPDFD